ncbi:apolipoprotein L3-like [Mirounga leonina]|uniref:apolipoprotein L3-like n=2 Tax=Mirounga leonina TaxID=9715 RepID=UPI00156C3062|nr:apolipoprotein L3-like [Mirounga leonina]XP_034858803.1 apolipoprotein L3-like [Mirounga leonina]XP_034859488.1 apolipoprotein L3-like [Mirounga leonina]XP_034860105.1 apolipoprotein L3-like [Mirounga leonina]XP_034882454.1 apolipoprotein L3-like [Mirounga leonina]XP_034884806.1 apolipoprotein L3-like [Mirounga leonina]
MSSEASELCPESKILLEDVIESFQSTVSFEELHFLLTDHEAWERFVAQAMLSREEADVLREDLKELERAMYTEAEDQLFRERLLSEFPKLKVELEERIRKLHELADEVDRVHKNCTISNIVAGTTGATSGLLSILGLGLAPFTAGTSLVLSAVGAGLGAASAVAQVSTSIVEYSIESSAKAQASHLTSTDFDKGKVVAKVLCDTIPQIGSVAGKSVQALQNIAKNVRAIKLAKVKPHLVVNARRFMTAQRVSVRSGRQVQKAFGGTALAMTKGARIMGAATAGLFLAMDVANLVKDSEHLKKGAKAQSADEMRQQARELENKLEKLTKIYESLKEGPNP